MPLVFRLFEPAALPAGFRYPAALVKLAAGPGRVDMFPWSFINAQSDIGKLTYLVRDHDGRNLVPFASVADDRKDIVCFDGNDGSGDPAVHTLIVEGQSDPCSFASFARWYAVALNDALQWRLQQSH